MRYKKRATYIKRLGFLVLLLLIEVFDPLALFCNFLLNEGIIAVVIFRSLFQDYLIDLTSIGLITKVSSSCVLSLPY